MELKSIGETPILAAVVEMSGQGAQYLFVAILVAVFSVVAGAGLRWVTKRALNYLHTGVVAELTGILKKPVDAMEMRIEEIERERVEGDRRLHARLDETSGKMEGYIRGISDRLIVMETTGADTQRRIAAIEERFQDVGDDLHEIKGMLKSSGGKDGKDN